MQQEFEGLRVTKKSKSLKKRGADMRSDEDTLGSYTGVCSENEYERPIQDADDL